jgi:hypothetical protein
MTIHALDKKMLMQNVLIKYRDRPQGSVSKLNTVSDGIKVIKIIFRLFKEYKPLSFFSILSFIFLLIGVLLCVPVLIDFHNTGLVPKFPSLIAASFFGIVSIQLFACGLILDTVVRKEKQNFELTLNGWNK